MMLLLLIVSLLIAAVWLSLCFFYTDDSPIITFLDKLVSRRIILSHKALLKFKPSLFGNDATFSFPIDPLFSYTLIFYGYWGLCIFLSMFYAGGIRIYKKAAPFAMIALLIFQMYNTQENVFLYHLFDLTMFTATCDLD